MEIEKDMELKTCSDEGMATDLKFSRLARKVRRRRFITAAALVAAAIFVTVCVVNYRQADISVKPPIVLSRGGLDNGQTTTEIYYSLGFKQVSYESEYGRNYCQRLWPWEEVEQNPLVLTAQQYQQLMAQLETQNRQKPVYNAYFKSFQTFDATILDVEKDDGRYTVYLKGAAYNFIEYNGAVYSNVDGDPNSEDYFENAQQPMIVTADWDGRRLKIQDVKTFQTGDLGSGAIFENFPKPVATRLLASIEGQGDTGQKAAERSKRKAIAHFGKNLADGTYLHFDDKTAKVELYRIVPDVWEPDREVGPQDNDELIKQETLKKIEE